MVVSTVGHMLTDRHLIDGCNVIALPGSGNAERVAEDKAADWCCCGSMARAISTPSAFGEAPKGSDLTLLGIADPQSQGGGARSPPWRQRPAARRVEPAPQLGFAGAAALDAQGRFAGMVVLKTRSLPAGPAVRSRGGVGAGADIRNFLEAQS